MPQLPIGPITLALNLEHGRDGVGLLPIPAEPDLAALAESLDAIVQPLQVMGIHIKVVNDARRKRFRKDTPVGAYP